jgi:peptidoglycan L-alanyl-D-glutamate endopeptidase CwlK
MRFRFGSLSNTRLSTAHPELQRLMRAAMDKQLMDFAITQGHRGEIEQNAAFASGASKTPWPRSRHNTVPSSAVDIAPYPIHWGESGTAIERRRAIGRFYKLAGIVLATAKELNINVRWGGDWNMDGNVFDQKFDDLVHFELVI